ncbi:hypothetical protein ACFL38_02780 [Candidatus Omnitrophota bacterium]
MPKKTSLVIVIVICFILLTVLVMVNGLVMSAHYKNKADQEMQTVPKEFISFLENSKGRISKRELMQYAQVTDYLDSYSQACNHLKKSHGFNPFNSAIGEFKDAVCAVVQRLKSGQLR